MPRTYLCADCGEPCEAPVYLRLMLTRCGLKEARKQAHRHVTVQLGHVCVKCLEARLRTATGDNLDLASLFGGVLPGSPDIKR